jgi:hypothetical protein
MIKKLWRLLTGGPDLHETWAHHDCVERGCIIRGKPASSSPRTGLDSNVISTEDEVSKPVQ